MIAEFSDSLLKTGTRLQSGHKTTVNAVAYTEETSNQTLAERGREVAGALQGPWKLLRYLSKCLQRQNCTP